MEKTKILDYMKSLEIWDENDLDDVFYDTSVMRVIHRGFKKQENMGKRHWLYLTLSPDKFKRNLPMEAEEELKKWCHKWFVENKIFYDGGVNIVESGPEDDHLHVHAVMAMKHSAKHADRLKKFWGRWFPKSTLITTLNLAQRGKNKRGEYCYATFSDASILEDKIKYFTNDYKCDHENKRILMEPVFFGEVY